MARKKKDDMTVATVFPENTDQPFQMVELSLIDPNPYQPRTKIMDSDVTDLARGLSIKRERLADTCGLMQIPLARYHVGRYQLAFGHRRYQAFSLNHYNAQRKVLDGDWSRMPLRVVDLGDEEMYDLAARENGDRQDLNDIEKARSIQLAQDEFGWSLSQAANAHGLSKSAGSNLVRLLQLPDGVLSWLTGGQLGQRHARALLPLIQREEPLTETCLQVAREAASNEWPVKRLEEWVTAHLGQLEYERLRKVRMAEEARRRAELAAKRETRYCYFCLKPQELTGLELAGNERVSCGHCGKTMTAGIWRREPRPPALLKLSDEGQHLAAGTSSGGVGTSSEGAGTGSGQPPQPPQRGDEDERVAGLVCPECGERELVLLGMGTVHCLECESAWSSVEAVEQAQVSGGPVSGVTNEEIPELDYESWASARPALRQAQDTSPGGEVSGGEVSSAPVSGVTFEGEQERELGEFDCPRCGQERVVKTNGGAWCLNCEAKWATVEAFHGAVRESVEQAVIERLANNSAGCREYRKQLLVMEMKLHGELQSLIEDCAPDHLGHIEDWLESVKDMIELSELGVMV